MKKLLLILWLLLVPSICEAAYLFTASFDPNTSFHYSILSCTFQNTISKDGYALKCSGAGQSARFPLKATDGSSGAITGQSTVAMCFDVYFESIGIFEQTFLQTFDTSGANAGELHLTSGGNLKWCNSVTCTSSLTGTKVFSPDTFYRICVNDKISVDGIKIWVDSEPSTQAADIDGTVSITATNVAEITLKSVAQTGLDVYFENLVINSTDLTTNAELAADMTKAWTYYLAITSDGDVACSHSGQTGCTASNNDCNGLDTATTAVNTGCGSWCSTTDYYKCVNYGNSNVCSEPGTDTSYPNSAAIEVWTFGIDNATTYLSDKDIYAVTDIFRYRASGGTTTTQFMLQGLGSSTDCSKGATGVETTSYDNYYHLVETKPAGGNYTLSDLDSLVIGLSKTNGNNNLRLETASVEFAYSDPVSSGYGNQSNGIMWFTKLFNFYKYFFQTSQAYAYLME